MTAKHVIPCILAMKSGTNRKA